MVAIYHDKLYNIWSMFSNDSFKYFVILLLILSGSCAFLHLIYLYFGDVFFGFCEVWCYFCQCVYVVLVVVYVGVNGCFRCFVKIRFNCIMCKYVFKCPG